MEKNSKIFVAGHNGLVGSAIIRKLQQEGYTNIITRTSHELDLTDQYKVNNFFSEENIEYVFLAAAKVGGIITNNTYRADCIYINLMIECNIIHASYKYGVKKLLFLGSNCIYPNTCDIPIKEEYLLRGYLEHTVKPYAVSKIAGIELCNSYRIQYGCNFISLIPTNIYGPNDNQKSRVIPGLLHKFIEAKQNNLSTINAWGSGIQRREFLHSDDIADACLYFMLTYNNEEIINIGSGKDISISELCNLIKEITGYTGDIIFDTTKPDGALRKVLDVTKATHLGWSCKIKLKDGIKQTYELIKNK
jgi:GDP-L-fucose synthase